MFSSQRKPMIKAAAEGDLKALTQLIKQKCTLDDKNEALLSAARHGQLPVVERLFRHGVLLDYRDADGKSALAHAVMSGHMDVFCFLVDCKQAKLDILDCESMTLLMLAARHAQTDLVRELIDRGCDVLEIDADGQTAFLHAASGWDYRGPTIMAMLLDKAPELINLADDYKITPLMRAAKTDKQNMVNFLLDHEADLSAKDNLGFTALEHAAQYGNLDVFNPLFQKTKQPLNLTRLLILAIKHNHINIITRLIELGADINKPNANGSTPIMLAARYATPKTVKFLLGCEPDVTAKNNQGETALFWAQGENANLLLRHRGKTQVTRDDIYACRASSKYPTLTTIFDKYIEEKNRQLYQAVEQNNVAEAASLIEQGATPNFVIDTMHTTLLHLVAEKGDSHLDMATLLIKAGARLDSQNVHNMTPLTDAIDRGHATMVCHFLQQGARLPYNALYVAAQQANPAMMDVLRQAGAHLNGLDLQFRTPLMHAAFHGNTATVKWLLAHEVNVRTKTPNGDTALSLATKNDEKDVVEALLQQSGRTKVTASDIINAHNIAKRSAHSRCLALFELYKEKAQQLDRAIEQGNTAEISHILKLKGVLDFPANDAYDNNSRLHTATAQPNNLDIIQLLVLHGADINDAPVYTTPLMRAAERADLETVQWLVSNGAEIKPLNTPKETVLMHAARNRACPAIAEWLVSQGASINDSDYFGYTALMCAALRNNTATLKFLVSNKADVHAVTQDGDTALGLAARHGNVATVNCLIANGAEVNPATHPINLPIVCAAEGKKTENIKALYRAGAHLDSAALDAASPEAKKLLLSLRSKLAIPHDNQAPNAALLATLETWLNNKTPGDFEIESVMMNHLLTPLNATETDHLRKILTQLNTNEPKKLTQLRHTLLTWIKKITHPKKAIASEATTHLQENYTAYKDSSQKDPQKPALFEILRVHESKGVNQSTGTWRDFIAIMKRQCEDEPRIPSVSTASLFAQNMPDGQEMQLIARPPTPPPLNKSQ